MRAARGSSCLSNLPPGGGAPLQEPRPFQFPGPALRGMQGTPTAGITKLSHEIEKVLLAKQRGGEGAAWSAVRRERDHRS